jgi:hypothetical protein
MVATPSLKYAHWLEEMGEDIAYVQEIPAFRNALLREPRQPPGLSNAQQASANKNVENKVCNAVSFCLGARDGSADVSA